MANPSLAFGALAKPSRLDRDVAKHKKRVAKRSEKRETDKAEAAIWRAICDVIFKRDQGRCRVCSCTVHQREDKDPKRRAHTHHIEYRSAGGSDETTNLALLCGECHSFEHQHRIEISGNGDGVLNIVSRDEAGNVIRQWQTYNSQFPNESRTA